MFHNEKRRAIGRGASFDERRDVWMVEIGQDLAFMPEASQHLGRIRSALHDLDRDLFVVQVIAALGQVGCAHPAVTDCANHAVGAEPRPEQHRPFEQGVGLRFDGGKQRNAVVAVGREKRFDFAAQLHIRTPGGSQQWSPLGQWQIRSGEKDLCTRFRLALAIITNR